jgi:hypothetical protein
MTRGQAPSNRCTLVLDEDYKLMLKGESFSYNDFLHLSTNPSNNALGGTLLVNSVANAKQEILEKKYTVELDWSRGVWNWTDSTGKITSPGQMITENLFNKLKLPSDNLILADDYDQIMLMISNQLVKKVINDL